MDIHVRRIALKHGRSDGYWTLTAADKATVIGQYLGHECPGYRNRSLGPSCLIGLNVRMAFLRIKVIPARTLLKVSDKEVAKAAE